MKIINLNIEGESNVRDGIKVLKEGRQGFLIYGNNLSLPMLLFNLDIVEMQVIEDVLVIPLHPDNLDSLRMVLDASAFQGKVEE